MNLNKPIQEDSINWYALHVYRNKVSNCRDMVNAINPKSDMQESESQRKLRNLLKDREIFGGGKNDLLRSVGKNRPC